MEARFPELTRLADLSYTALPRDTVGDVDGSRHLLLPFQHNIGCHIVAKVRAVVPLDLPCGPPNAEFIINRFAVADDEGAFTSSWHCYT